MDLKKDFDIRSKLTVISRNLKIYDKVSVVFLLCDKPNAGARMIEMLSTASESMRNKAFYVWARKQSLFACADWRERFAAVLAAVKNYRMAAYLGFDRDRLNKRLTSKTISATFEIKIALYKLCESFNRQQTAALINAVDKRFNAFSANETLTKYLEGKILDWSAKNVISIDGSKKINLDAIMDHLERLNMCDMITELRNVIGATEFRMLQELKSMQLRQSLPEYYGIRDERDLGMCVIINQKSFPGSVLKKRWGSSKDVERLKEVFTAYGFRVCIHSDLVYDEFERLLNRYAKEVPERDSFFVLIILSHGSENVIYTSDSVPVPMETIEMIFQAENCPNLIGKPKIFIIQSCQGQKWQKILEGCRSDCDVEENQIAADAPSVSPARSDTKCTGPQKGDSIIAWSTVLGYASFRDKYNGSWYIEELCKELWKFGHVTDLVDILTVVNNNLRKRSYDGQFMVPSLLSSLSGKIRFPRVEDNLRAGRELMFKRIFFETYLAEFLTSSMTDSEMSPLEAFIKLGIKS